MKCSQQQKKKKKTPFIEKSENQNMRTKITQKIKFLNLKMKWN
jgi:hypothetical protein